MLLVWPLTVLKEINSCPAISRLDKPLLMSSRTSSSRGLNGSIIVDNTTKTNKDNVFACGDYCSKILHQIVTACGDGALSAYSAGQYVDELKGVAYK